ncbi:hypothetical protein ACWCZ5_19760 [Streptomyces sp. NPDC001667]
MNTVREQEVGHEEFLAPGRDRAQARAVRRGLQEMAEGGAGEVLQEMARDILSGRIGLREALRVGPYATALAERVRAAHAEWGAMPAADRERHMAEARRFLAAQGDGGEARGSRTA